MQRLILTAACGFLLLLAGCESDRSEPHRTPGAAHRDGGQRKAFHPPVELIKKYDANGDGTITLAEMKSILRKEFAAADISHDGVLDENEGRAVNAARWAALGSTSSPLIDWNQDGHINFDEFAAAMIALFDQFDRNQDGTLQPNEINPQPQRKAGEPPPVSRPPQPQQ